MDEFEQKAIKELRESGYIVYNDGILFKCKQEGHSMKIEIIPWINVRNIIKYEHLKNTVNVYLWGSEPIEFFMELKPGVDADNIFNYLMDKFTTALTKQGIGTYGL